MIKFPLCGTVAGLMDWKEPSTCGNCKAHLSLPLPWTVDAERMPQLKPPILTGMLHMVTRAAIRRPIVVLVAAVALAVLATLFTGLQLGFHTSRLDLLNPDSSYNKLWLDYIREFGAADDVLVVVEADSPENVAPALDEMAKTLERDQRHFRSVLHQLDFSAIRSKGLHYLPPQKLASIEQFVTETKPIVEGQWTQLSVGNMAAAMNQRLAMASRDPTGNSRQQAETEVAHWTRSLQHAMKPELGYCTPWPQVTDSPLPNDLRGTQHFLMADGRMGIVLLQLAGEDESGGFARGSVAIDALRRHIRAVAAHHPDTRIGLTGLPVMENDEMRSSQTAMIEASLLSLFGVACLFVAGFGGIRHPLLTVACLLLAMAWSFGYITLAVGHLNILSVSFAVILIGLGIDFGIHYVARYLQLRESSLPVDEALVETAGSVGPGILTGAVTTAIAFFTAGVTEFTGIAELGIVAGGGILLCCAAALVVLPAMVHLTDRNRHHESIPAPLDVFAWIRPLFRHPSWLFCVSIGATTLVGLGMIHLSYDHNLLNLQPKDLESVRLERRLIEESDQSVWFALSLAQSSEEVLARKEQFESLKSVDRVDEIVSLIPADEHLRQPIIARIQSQLQRLPTRAPAIPIERPETIDPPLAQLQAALACTPQGQQIAAQVQWIRAAMAQTPEAECYRRLSQYQHRVADDLLGGLQSLAEVSNPEPPEYSDLPESLVSRFLGTNGRHLMKVYSHANIWDMEAMERFVQEVRSVDPKATGNPLQTYEASRQMKRSYEQAAWYALVAIFLVLYVDFRNLGHTLLAMLPVGLGMLLLFGLLGWLGEPLNPANMIVLPLILGIGVDDGVHVVHDYLRRKGGYRMSPSTASAVLITSLTTMVGFGSLMIADHRGLQSLGRVLTIGVTCCLFTSLVMLPAALAWSTQNENSLDLDSTGAEDMNDPQSSTLRDQLSAEPPLPKPMDRAA